LAAEAVAGGAALTAAAVQHRADESAIKVSLAAAQAATIVAEAQQPGGDREAALAALRLAATVKAAAVALAEDTAAAAVGVAAAVTAAAAAVAYRASALDVAIEGEVAEVAAALQTAATATARQVAADTDARASDVAMVAREVAAAKFLGPGGEGPTPENWAPTAKSRGTVVSTDMRR
jgi:hypothetical protein